MLASRTWRSTTRCAQTFRSSTCSRPATLRAPVIFSSRVGILHFETYYRYRPLRNNDGPLWCASLSTQGSQRTNDPLDLRPTTWMREHILRLRAPELVALLCASCSSETSFDIDANVCTHDVAVFDLNLDIGRIQRLSKRFQSSCQ